MEARYAERAEREIRAILPQARRFRPRDRVGQTVTPACEEQRLPRKEARMHNAGDLAALVAAFFFAVLVCAGVYVLIRLARLISEGTRLVADMRSRSDTVFARVHAAVDRANQQLDATSTVTAGMDELGAGMSELTDQVSALAGLARRSPRPGGTRGCLRLRRAPRRRDPPRRDGAAGARPSRPPPAPPPRPPPGRPRSRRPAAAQPVAQPGDRATAGGAAAGRSASRRRWPGPADAGDPPRRSG